MRGERRLLRGGPWQFGRCLALLAGALLAGCGEGSKMSAPDVDGARGGVSSAPRAPDTGALDLSECDGVVIIALDAASADIFSFLGGARATTPHLAELAERALVCEDCVLVSTGLNGAFAALLTGRHGREHGVGSLHTLGRTRLRDAEVTLAEAFRARGWHTLLSVAVPQLHPGLSGFAQGFESIHVPQPGAPSRRADQVIGTCRPTLQMWLRSRAPFFALIQLSDLDGRGDLAAPAPHGARWLEAHLAPHTPALPKVADALAKAERSPDAALSDLAQLLQRARGSAPTRAWRAALRDGRASAVDAEVGGLLELLRESGRLERTLVIVAGMRGAPLEQPDESVGPRFLPEVLRTPLVVSFPSAAKGPRGRRRETVSALALPRALDTWFELGLGATEYAGGELLERGARAGADGVGDAERRSVAFAASADLSLAALITKEAQCERSAGGDDHLFRRSGRILTLDDPQPNLVARDRFDAFAAPATLTFASAASAEPLEVGWRIEQGLTAGVRLQGEQGHDLTSQRDRMRRRSGRVRLGGGASLEVGLTERTAAVRLDLALVEGSLDPARIDVGGALTQSMVPRVPIPRVLAWPPDGSEGAELPLVDVQREVGTRWRIAVNCQGPSEVLLTLWPPRAAHDRLDVEAGGRAVAEQIAGRGDVVRVQGDGPYDFFVQKGPDEHFAFAARSAEGVVDARRVRVEARRMAGDADLSIVLPGWLPGVTEGLFGAPAAGDPGALWTVRRSDPAGMFGPEQALDPDWIQFVRTLPGGE